MANTTLSRKAGNTMKKGEGYHSPMTRSDQEDKNMDFDGLRNGSSQGHTANHWAYNQHTGVCNEGALIQHAQMPNRKGNIERHEARRVPPATAGASKNPVHSGARSWEPNAKENFKGNADKIQDRQMYNRVGNKD